jgi:hypothetical protein
VNRVANAEPRHFGALAGLPGAGLPNDRLARIAARRSFVQLKTDFMAAVATLDDPRWAWLHTQVRQAQEIEDLLLLRGHVFDGLAGNDVLRRQHRRTLRRGLDQLFPDSAPPSGFIAF